MLALFISIIDYRIYKNMKFLGLVFVVLILATISVKFLGRENKQEYPYQTSWGLTTRIIGALIMVHSDDRGLVLPPKIAPTQVSIINIDNKDEEINEFSHNNWENVTLFSGSPSTSNNDEYFGNSKLNNISPEEIEKLL